MYSKEASNQKQEIDRQHHTIPNKRYNYTQQEIGKMYGRCRSTTGYQIRRTLQLLHKGMEVLSRGKSEPFIL